MKAIIVGAFAAIALTACTTVSETTRLTSNIKGAVYNSVGNQYYDRPTFVRIETMSDGASVFVVEVEDYVSDRVSYTSVGPTSVNPQVRFTRENVPTYVEHIDKYLEWEATAVADGDQLTKTIGKADGWKNGPTQITVQFGFHSGNASSHFLTLATCAIGTCVEEDAIYMSKTSALALKNELIQFGSGEIKSKNLDAKYQ